MHVWEIEVDIAYLKMKPGCLEAHRCEDSPQEQLQRRNNDKLEIWREAHHSLSLKVKENYQNYGFSLLTSLIESLYPNIIKESVKYLKILMSHSRSLSRSG